MLGGGAVAAWITESTPGFKGATWPAWLLSALTICTVYGCFAYAMGIWPANGAFRRAGPRTTTTQAVAAPPVTPGIQRGRQPYAPPEPGQANRQQEEVPARPPVVREDLHGLGHDRIRLLRDSAVVVRDLLTVSVEARRTSPLAQREFASVSARMKSALNRAEAQFLALKGSVTVLNWPDREWAAEVTTVRETAERELKAAARWNTFGAGDQPRPWPFESLTELLGLLEQYSGLFTTEL